MRVSPQIIDPLNHISRGKCTCTLKVPFTHASEIPGAFVWKFETEWRDGSRYTTHTYLKLRNHPFLREASREKGWFTRCDNFFTAPTLLVRETLFYNLIGRSKICSTFRLKIVSQFVSNFRSAIGDRTHKEDGRKRCRFARMREGGGVPVGIYHPAKN